MKPKAHTYNRLINNIGTALHIARTNAAKVVNEELVKANWQIGQYIVEFEQTGKERAAYGTTLIDQLSKDLRGKYGAGFSKSNLYLCRLFYLKFGIFQTVSGKLLSWSHYAELLSVSDDLAKSFYEKQAIIENWSFRQMKRQIDAALFHRLALSKDKKAILKLAAQGQKVVSIEDTIKDPYIFEFLNIPNQQVVKEKTLEKKIIDNLQNFLLELGKGFTFVARQFRLTIDNIHYNIDLVFYHRILKCFVLIDLKTRKVKHQDIGQLNLYLNYFLEEENMPDDKPPIGIIVAADKNDLMVKYATGGISNKIFVSKYQFYLPEQKILENKVRQIIKDS